MSKFIKYLNESVSSFKIGEEVGVFNRDKSRLLYTGKIINIQKDGGLEVKPHKMMSSGQHSIVVSEKDLIKISNQ